MRAEFHIQDNQTGETRIYRDEFDVDLDSLIFRWTEGDYSCDCWRRLLFDRLGPEAEGPRTCGTERYSVPKAIIGGVEIEIDDN